MRSTPNNRTAAKQKGKSSADNRKYIPSAAHPYSLVSWRHRCENDCVFEELSVEFQRRGGRKELRDIGRVPVTEDAKEGPEDLIEMGRRPGAPPRHNCRMEVLELL